MKWVWVLFVYPYPTHSAQLLLVWVWYEKWMGEMEGLQEEDVVFIPHNPNHSAASIASAGAAWNAPQIGGQKM